MDKIRGTITEILDNGKSGQNWSALVTDKNQDIIFVESQIPLDLEVGDSAEFSGKITLREKSMISKDILINTHSPKQFRENAFYKNKIITVLGSSNTVESVAKNLQKNTPYKFIGLKLNQDDIEPEIKWGINIFQKLNLHTGKGIIIILQPSLVYKPNYPNKLNVIKRFLFPKSSTSVFRNKKDIEQYLPEMMPVHFKKHTINNYHNMHPIYSFIKFPLKSTLYQISEEIMPYDIESSSFNQISGVIIPYDIKSSSFNQILAVSTTYHKYNEFYPNKLPSLKSINKVTIAHELAHAYSHDYYGSIYVTNYNNNLNRKEIFADAVSMMVCLNNGVPEKDLKMIANARLIAFLRTDSLSYDTGIGCIKAIEKGKELQKKYQGKSVPIDIILLEASKITEENHQNSPIVKDIFISKFKQYPDFIKLQKDQQIKILDECMIFTKNNSNQDKNLLIVEEQISHIQKTLQDDFYNIHELLHDQNKMKKCMNLKKKSLNESIQNLRKKNLQHMIPDIIKEEAQSTLKMEKSFAFKPMSQIKKLSLSNNEMIFENLKRIMYPTFGKIKKAITFLRENYEHLSFKVKHNNTFFLQEIKSYQKSIHQINIKNKKNIMDSSQNYKTNKTPTIKLKTSISENDNSKPFDVFQQTKNIISLYNERSKILEQAKQLQDTTLIYQANLKREQLYDINKKILFIPKNEEYFKRMFYADHERLDSFIRAVLFSENVSGHTIDEKKLSQHIDDLKIQDIDIFMKERQHSLFLYDKSHHTQSRYAQQYVIDSIEEINKVQLKKNMIIKDMKLTIDITYRPDFKEIILQNCDVTDIPNDILKYCKVIIQDTPSVVQPVDIQPSQKHKKDNDIDFVSTL